MLTLYAVIMAHYIYWPDTPLLGSRNPYTAIILFDENIDLAEALEILRTKYKNKSKWSIKYGLSANPFGGPGVNLTSQYKDRAYFCLGLES